MRGVKQGLSNGMTVIGRGMIVWIGGGHGGAALSCEPESYLIAHLLRLRYYEGIYSN